MSLGRRPSGAGRAPPSAPGAVTRPLRVLVATPLGAGGRGGIDRMMDAVRRALAAHPPPGLAVTVVATRGQGSLARSPGRMLRALGQLARRPDVLHINLSSRGSALRKLVLAAAARALSVPTVVHLHGSGFDAWWDAAPAPLRAQVRRMFAGAARIVVLGRVWREAVAARVPEAAGRIVVLPNAAPAAEPARGGTPPTILFLGRLGPRKGVPQLVAALAGLPPGLPWRAVLAGDGDHDAARRDLDRHGLADRVALPGWLDDEGVRRHLAEADILALPSFAENLPMALVEAFAHGLAVVATPVGAVEDLVAHGRTGLLVPPGDVPALSDALQRLLVDVGLRRSLGAAARAFHADHLEIGRYGARLAAIWADAAE